MNDYIDELEYSEQIDDTEFYEKQIEKLQDRIDKAIEYINRNTCANVEEQCNSLYLYDEYLNNLLKILRGEDNENR